MMLAETVGTITTLSRSAIGRFSGFAFGWGMDGLPILVDVVAMRRAVGLAGFDVLSR